MASRASEGQEGRSALGLNQMDAGIGGGSGQLESIEALAAARSGARPGKPRWGRILAMLVVDAATVDPLRSSKKVLV